MTTDLRTRNEDGSLTDAVVVCRVSYYGHKHGDGCYGWNESGVTHHRRVLAEGRDWQCACGTWGCGDPSSAYAWHLESEITRLEREARDR